ncbi:MAG: hypothetical protein AB7P69_03715 [Candidatus Binatia bacterium]
MKPNTLRQLSECRGKLAFFTEAQAADGARDLRAQRGYVGRTYECEWCGYWHIGRLGKKKRVLP